jgi:flagellin-specific chaperone FliS
MSLSAKSIDLNTQPVDEITPYRIITLLLDGALERVDQAIISLDEYIVGQLQVIDDYDEPVIILDEVRKLLNEVHLGWVEIESQV